MQTDSIVDLVECSNGDIAYRNPVEAIPNTTKKEGNVTINNIGSPGSPGHYEATFMITADTSNGDLKRRNVFHWTTLIANGDDNAPYRQIESEGVRQIAPMLRAVADQMEALVADFEAKKAERMG